MNACLRAYDRFAVEAVEKIKLPRIHRLGRNLYVLKFECMKIVVAMHLLREALATGRLQPGGLVVETSSGTFGLALALAATALGLRVHLVGDPGIDAGLMKRFEILGVTVDIVEPQPGHSLQALRLERLAEVRAQNPEHFWPCQYDNAGNRRAYHEIADYAAAQILCDIDILVGAVGSGGSTGGTTERLRAQGHTCRLVGVDTQGSVLFGLRDAPRLLRGLGNSIYPKNIHHSLYDEIHWIPPGLAFSAARWFFAKYALDLGPTSGAALVVAQLLAAENPHANIVAIAPDNGERYRDTVLAPLWLGERGLLVDVPSAAPVSVAHPAEVGQGWTRMGWGRRALEEVRQAKTCAR